METGKYLPIPRFATLCRIIQPLLPHAQQSTEVTLLCMPLVCGSSQQGERNFHILYELVAGARRSGLAEELKASTIASIASCLCLPCVGGGGIHSTVNRMVALVCSALESKRSCIQSSQPRSIAVLYWHGESHSLVGMGLAYAVVEFSPRDSRVRYHAYRGEPSTPCVAVRLLHGDCYREHDI